MKYVNLYRIYDNKKKQFVKDFYTIEDANIFTRKHFEKKYRTNLSLHLKKVIV